MAEGILQRLLSGQREPMPLEMALGRSGMYAQARDRQAHGGNPDGFTLEQLAQLGQAAAARLGQAAAGLGQAAWGAFTLPGDVYRGEVNPNSQEAIERSADLAGFVTGTPGGIGGLGSGARVAAKPGIRAYHGSPHDFDRFDMGKIGTGEGAQAYGHGLYFAEREGVAKQYRDKLGGRIAPEKPEALAQSVLDAVGGDRARAVAELRSRMKGATIPEFSGRAQQAIDLIQSEAPLSGGRMYAARINASPDEFLDWDLPLSQQPQTVQSALKGHGWDVEEAGNALGSGIWFGHSAARKNPAAVAEELRAAGIKGIRYKDQGSRGAEGGTSNYVVFDDQIIDILKKYGIAGLAALGGAGMVAGSGGQAEARPQRHPLAGAPRLRK